MLTALAILGVLAALFLAAALATRDGEALAPVAPDAADLELPDGPVGADDVRGLRFGLAARGYRMSEVDAALERIAADLEARDRRIAELEGTPYEPVPAVGPVPQVEAFPTAAFARDDDFPQVDPVAQDEAFPQVDTSAEDDAFPQVGTAAEDDAFPEVGTAATDEAFGAELAFPDIAPPEESADDTPDAPDLAVGQAPVEPVDPPVRSGS